MRDVACDACRRPESLDHILQVCPRTSGGRNDRHNAILAGTVKTLIKKGWSVLVEPAIPTPAGLRRPDMIAWNSGNKCYIIDVTVAADNADLRDVHRHKVEHYDNEYIRNWARGVSSKKGTIVSSINWRGALAVESYNLQIGDMGIGENNIQLLAAIVLERGFKCYLDFRNSTYRCPR